MGKKIPLLIAVCFAILLVGVAIIIAIHFTILTVHQISINQHKNAKQLDIVDFRYATKGIALLVYSKSEIIEINKQQRALFIPYIKTEHKSFKTNRDNNFVVLVKYDFIPNKEWYLELLNKDGFWISISPLFSNAAELSSQHWKSLWNNDEKAYVQINDVFKRENGKMGP